MGVAAALIGVAAYVWYHQRQKQRKINRSEHPNLVRDEWVVPFPYTHDDSVDISNRSVSTTERKTNAERVRVSDYGPGYKVAPSLTNSNAPLLNADASRDSFARSEAGLRDPSQGDSMPTASPGLPSRVIQHQDANDVVELPPPYIDRGAT